MSIILFLFYSYIILYAQNSSASYSAEYQVRRVHVEKAIKSEDQHRIIMRPVVVPLKNKDKNIRTTKNIIFLSVHPETKHLKEVCMKIPYFHENLVFYFDQHPLTPTELSDISFLMPILEKILEETNLKHKARVKFVTTLPKLERDGEILINQICS